jgi:hypothetical protein
MTGTTTKYLVERADSVDVDAMAAAWAARPQPGLLSPRDTADAAVGGARVAIDYGRPSMRGRQVFGGIVPWDQVWRLGANAATQLITDKDLAIGGTPVPAGTYSLWALPTPGGMTLIINRRHGQWGTQYDPDQDFARIPLILSRLAEPVERLTMSVTQGASGEGTLALEWENTRAAVAFSVR